MTVQAVTKIPLPSIWCFGGASITGLAEHKCPRVSQDLRCKLKAGKRVVLYAPSWCENYTNSSTLDALLHCTHLTTPEPQQTQKKNDWSTHRHSLQEATARKQQLDSNIITCLKFRACLPKGKHCYCLLFSLTANDKSRARTLLTSPPCCLFSLPWETHPPGPSSTPRRRG